MAKRNKNWDDLVRRGKTEMLKAPQQFAGMGIPPAPGSPDSTKFYNESKMRQEMANDPQNANRLAQNKRGALKGLAEEASPKKNALKKMLEKLKGGKGGRLGGISGGGGVMPYDVR
jgi:hypothetical protein